MLTPFRVALAIGLLNFASAAVAQQTISVGASGTYPTIQQGVNAANAGDTVQVQPGTYAENVTITGKAITLQALACAGTSPAAGCNSQTTIDGNNQGSVVTVSNVLSLRTVIQGFTLVNGRSGSSGSNAGVELDNAGAVVTNNSLSANAVAVAVSNGAITFTANTVNTLIPAGTACSSGNGIYLTGTNTTVLDSTGAVAGTLINGNTIAAGGKCIGGVGIIDQQGSATAIAFNQISGQALGINIFPTTAATYIYDNLITGNTTGGISIIHTSNSPSGPADTFIMNNTVANNLSAAKGFSGGAGPAELAVSGSFSQILVINNIFSTNSATNPDVDCAGTPSSSTHQITPIIFDHNLFYNSGANGKLGTNGCPVTAGSYGNINANPQFMSATNFQLATGSPAIDTGNNSYALVRPYLTDLAGNQRVLNGTGLSGPVVDMGAYEAPCLGGFSTQLNFSVLSATSSSYFLVAGNSFSITAQLGETSDGLTFTHPGFQMLTFTGSGVPTMTGITDANGNVTIPYTPANPGLYAFTVSYPGPTYSPATSIVLYVYVANPLAVTTLGLSSSKNPSLVGQPVTFTVTSNATDSTHPSTVVLADNGTTLATLTTSSGTATYTTSALALGTHPLTATFAGDATHTQGSASLSQQVGSYVATTTALSSSVNPSLYGQSVVLTAHVSATGGVPTGSVVFVDGSTQLGNAVTVDASGNATYTTTAFAVGTHSLAANFTATGSYSNSSGTLTQTVNPDPTKSVLTVTPSSGISYGTAVTLTAVVSVVTPYSGTPTGAVTFYDGTTVLGVSALTATSTATLQVNTLGAGPHTLSCVYNGAANLASSTCNAVTINVAAATTAISVSSSANASPALTPITFTATLTSGGQALASGASVTLTITPAGGAASSYPLTTGSGGTASYVSPGLAAGSYAVAASYAATANYSGSNASITEVVTVNPTTMTLIATPSPGLQNHQETFLATVAASAGASAPAGSVTFLDGTTPLGTVAVTSAGGVLSSAQVNTSALLPGVHTISALFSSSSSSFSGVGPVTISLTIAPQDFTLGSTPASITVQTEHHATFQFNITSIGGFSAPVTLTCGPLPVYATCNIPDSIAVNPSGVTNVNVTLDTDVLLNFAGVRSTRPGGNFSGKSSGMMLALFLPLTLAGGMRFRKRLRGRISSAALAVALLIAAGSMGACSGHYPDHTPAGSYVIPITASGTAPGSSTPTTHTLNVTLTVTP